MNRLFRSIITFTQEYMERRTYEGNGNVPGVGSGIGGGNNKNHRMRYYKKYQPYNTLIGEPISLPCNITPPTSDDDVSLILWYRDDQSTPIYTVDARGIGNSLKTAKHFHDMAILGDDDRVTFNITYPISYLRFIRTIATDTAEYRCRVDFRRDRTINRVMQLNVIVPANKLSIYDTGNNYINDIAGPFNEDIPLNLTCLSEGGYPLPKVRWWKGEQMIGNHSITVNNVDGNKATSIMVKNVIKFDKVLREHLMMPLTCESTNTNLTVPVTKTILIDLNLKPIEVKIVRPLHNMTVGQKIELVCQSSGSRPPAKIEWRKDGKLMEHFSETTSDDGSVTTNYLAFIPTIDDNGRQLSCVAKNPQFKRFELEDRIELNIQYAPILSLLLGANAKQQEIVEDSSVYFDCNIQANPPVKEFGWLFNGEELDRQSIMNMMANHDHQKFETLIGHKPMTNGRVIINHRDNSKNNDYNDDVVVDDEDGGNNDDDDDDDDVVVDNNNNNNNDNINRIEIRNNSIIINNVNRQHIGGYQCWATNQLGKSYSEIVQLNVKYAPICSMDETINEMTFELELFEQLSIGCNVHADPRDVMFFWEFNSSSPTADMSVNIEHHHHHHLGKSNKNINNALDSVDDDDDDGEGNDENRSRPLMSIQNHLESPYRSVLHFTPRSIDHYGTLYCFAQNRIGRQRQPCIYHIRKSETPMAPKNCSLQNITSTSLTVQCPSYNHHYFYSNVHSSQEQHSSIDDDGVHHLSATNGNYHYILLIYNGLNQLIRNLSEPSSSSSSSSSMIKFNINDLSANDMDNLNMFIYAINRNGGGQSERIRVPVTNLVGQPKKLEHIEQFRLNNIRPFLLLIFIVACLITSIGAFIVMVIIKLGRRRRRNKTTTTTTTAAKKNYSNVKNNKDHIDGNHNNNVKQTKATTTTTTIRNEGNVFDISNNQQDDDSLNSVMNVVNSTSVSCVKNDDDEVGGDTLLLLQQASASSASHCITNYNNNNNNQNNNNNNDMHSSCNSFQQQQQQQHHHHHHSNSETISRSNSLSRMTNLNLTGNGTKFDTTVINGGDCTIQQKPPPPPQLSPSHAGSSSIEMVTFMVKDQQQQQQQQHLHPKHCQMIQLTSTNFNDQHSKNHENISTSLYHHNHNHNHQTNCSTANHNIVEMIDPIGYKIDGCGESKIIQHYHHNHNHPQQLLSGNENILKSIATLPRRSSTMLNRSQTPTTTTTTATTSMMNCCQYQNDRYQSHHNHHYYHHGSYLELTTTANETNNNYTTTAKPLAIMNADHQHNHPIECLLYHPQQQYNQICSIQDDDDDNVTMINSCHNHHHHHHHSHVKICPTTLSSSSSLLSTQIDHHYNNHKNHIVPDELTTVYETNNENSTISISNGTNPTTIRDYHRRRSTPLHQEEQNFLAINNLSEQQSNNNNHNSFVLTSSPTTTTMPSSNDATMVMTTTTTTKTATPVVMNIDSPKNSFPHIIMTTQTANMDTFLTASNAADSHHQHHHQPTNGSIIIDQQQQQQQQQSSSSTMMINTNNLSPSTSTSSSLLSPQLPPKSAIKVRFVE
ncbi:hypothetical protein DERF_005989 [Dermatophagoides farinae]|uniref:Ig-like domain-containing protein n=1 Tax=Dermatophagoides farinae TaxID=6954 RepID=A0A922LBT0_DERFA|nr:hypothetical protein DERF_005989 [Dermatophagoides farinae]